MKPFAEGAALARPVDVVEQTSPHSKDCVGGTEVIYDVRRSPTVMPVRFSSVADDLNVVVDALHKAVVGLKAEHMREGHFGACLRVCVSGGCDLTHLDAIVKGQLHVVGLCSERRVR